MSETLVGDSGLHYPSPAQQAWRSQELDRLGRREFLALSALSAIGLWLPDLQRLFAGGEKLGRVTEPRVKIHSRPRPDGREVGTLDFDDVVVAYREVVGIGVYAHNHVWVETPDGYVWSPHLQPVRDIRNPVLEALPEGGVWMEVTVPYVDGRSAPDPSAPVRYRLYYAMVLNVDARVEGTDGRIWYRVHDETGVRMHAPGEAFRQITPDEIAPLSPQAERKEIYVNLTRQDLSAMEDGVEVYYTRVASGYSFDEKGQRRWNTPVGRQWTWRKMISSHMAGGDRVSGWDLPGVGWVILFSGIGAALHSTYWHNDFGTPRSRGCINARPEDAKWLFRWSKPSVPYKPGDVTIQGPVGSPVIVTE